MARKESRKTTGGEARRSQAPRGGDARQESSRGEEVLGTGKMSQSQSSRNEERGGTATATRPITHAQIAERARQIWEQHGCPQGEDEKNWREAERQLKAEAGID